MKYDKNKVHKMFAESKTTSNPISLTLLKLGLYICIHG